MFPVVRMFVRPSPEHIFSCVKSIKNYFSLSKYVEIFTVYD